MASNLENLDEHDRIRTSIDFVSPGNNPGYVSKVCTGAEIKKVGSMGKNKSVMGVVVDMVLEAGEVPGGKTRSIDRVVITEV